MEMTYLAYMIPLVVDEVPLPLPKPIYPCKPLQTLTHPSLLTTLPHNPSYNLALYFTLPKTLLNHHFYTTLSLYLVLNPCIFLTLPYSSPLTLPPNLR